MWALLWRGIGWAVPVVVIVVLLVMQLTINSIFGPEFYQTQKWPKDAAILLAMILIGLLGWHYNFRKRTTHKDPTTEVVTKSPQHHFLFVPVQYWALIIPLFFIWASEGAEKYRARDVALINAPQLGDIYYINMQEIKDGYTEAHKYGAMKVVGFDDANIIMVMSNTFYIKSRQPRIDYSRGEMQGPHYFNPTVVSYKKSDLIVFRKDGSLLSIKRPE